MHRKPTNSSAVRTERAGMAFCPRSPTFMLYAVYADLPRRLTSAERSAVADALDENVPGSGCVGLQKGPNDEVCFRVEATSDEEAGAQAARYISVVLCRARLADAYTLYIAPFQSGS
jgi:hypothetical protein